MSSDTDNKQVIVVKESQGSGCLVAGVIIVLVLVAALGWFDTVLEEANRRGHVSTAPTYPALASDTNLGIQSSTVVIEQRPTAMPPVVVYQPEQAPAVVVPFVGPTCTMPEGWRLGMVLPDCWGRMTRQEQNEAIERSRAR